MNGISIESDHLQEIKRMLNEQLPHAKAWIFGSRVSGKPHRPQADVDILIDNKNPLSIEESARIRTAFSESDLPMRVDFIDRNKASAEFLHVVETGPCIELQGGEKQARIECLKQS